VDDDMENAANAMNVAAHTMESASRAFLLHVRCSTSSTPWTPPRKLSLPPVRAVLWPPHPGLCMLEDDVSLCNAEG
jgi:hypothetical protein